MRQFFQNRRSVARIFSLEDKSSALNRVERGREKGLLEITGLSKKVERIWMIEARQRSKKKDDSVVGSMTEKSLKKMFILKKQKLQK